MLRAAAVLLLCSGALAAPAPFEADIAAFEAADRQTPPPQGAVLFVGSSSIRLWESLEKDFPGKTVLNRGFGGSQIADSVRFAGRIVIPYKPRHIVFYAGDNDVASGRTPRQVLSDFRAFVRKVRKALPDTPISFVSIKPCPARWSLIRQVREANRLVKGYADKEPGLDYVDVFTPMLGSDGKPRKELFGPDGLHMSPEGYRLWAGLIAPRL